MYCILSVKRRKQNKTRNLSFVLFKNKVVQGLKAKPLYSSYRVRSPFGVLLFIPTSDNCLLGDMTGHTAKGRLVYFAAILQLLILQC